MITSKLTDRPEWHALQAHHQNVLTKVLQTKTSCQNPLFSLEMDALRIDCFYQHVDKQTPKYLVNLAKACGLSERIEDLFQGKNVNISENRAAWHTALRDLKDIQANKPDIQACLNKMRQISDTIRAHRWLGYTGKPVQAIIHIGIGGSDLSQRFACDALKKYAQADIQIHFVANIDPDDMDSTLAQCDPETTLVIVASKSFSTRETQMNMDLAMQWLADPRAIAQQVLAITGAPEKIIQRYALPSAHILPIWDWVGGRYSIWSAMGLILMIAIGFEHFQTFLSGANAMDVHFRYAPFEKNIPVMLALMGIWNIHFYDCQTYAVIPYAHRLRYLLAHLQQLDMESNGKSFTLFGEPVDYPTGSIVWGGVGSNSQHSFHQLLHQGTHCVPVDFIAIEHGSSADQRTHWLNANCHAQIQSLLNNQRCFIHLITLQSLTPYTLGALLAMYEHKIFVQSQIWHINPFDQPGVEQAKVLAQEMMVSTL